MPGWFPVLPVPSSIIPASLPLGMEFGTALGPCGYFTLFLFYYYIFPSAFFSPGGEISPCSCPILQTIHAHLCHLCGEFLWQFPSLAALRRSCHCPFPLLLLSSLLFPPCSWACTFPSATAKLRLGGKGRILLTMGRFLQGKVFFGKTQRRFLTFSQASLRSCLLPCSSTLLRVMLRGCHGSPTAQTLHKLHLEHLFWVHMDSPSW